jgi:hypothetical protein
MKYRTALIAATLVAPAALICASPAPAAPCAQYAFPGFLSVNQSNGYRVEFPATGQGFADARASQINNQQAIVNEGIASGVINNRAIKLTIRWNNGTVGDYTGSIQGDKRGEGTTSGGGGSASWNTVQGFTCMDAEIAEGQAADAAAAQAEKDRLAAADQALRDKHAADNAAAAEAAKPVFLANSITTDITTGSGAITVNVANASGLPATCDLSFNPFGGGKSQKFDIAAKGNSTRTIRGIGLGIDYEITVSCNDASGSNSSSVKTVTF